MPGRSSPLLPSFFGFTAMLAAAGCGGNVTVDKTNTGVSGQSGSQHWSCELPAPAPMPALPQVNMDEGGRPSFDRWRDVDCSAPSEFPAGCDSGGDCLHGGCLVSADSGACTYSDVDIWCEGGDGEVVGYRDGTCWMCSPVETHAAACCAGQEGFDCRAWPFPGDSGPGEVCARHEDCEPGLVCGASAGVGYGLCQCPGTDPATLTPPTNCLQ